MNSSNNDSEISLKATITDNNDTDTDNIFGTGTDTIHNIDKKVVTGTFEYKDTDTDSITDNIFGTGTDTIHDFDKKRGYWY